MQSVSFLIHHIYTSAFLLPLILTLKILPSWSAIPDKYCPVENISYLFHHIYLLHNLPYLFLLITYFWHINSSSKMKTDLLSVLSRSLRKWKEDIRRRLSFSKLYFSWLERLPLFPSTPYPKLIHCRTWSSQTPLSLISWAIALLVLFQFLKCAELLPIPKHPCKLVHIMWLPLPLSLQASYTSLWWPLSWYEAIYFKKLKYSWFVFPWWLRW